MKTNQELRNLLHQIDRKSYPAYKQLREVYRFDGYFLSIDHVQGDPFAAPSKVSIQVPGSQAGFDTTLLDTPEKKRAVEDYVLRQFGRQLRNFSFQAKGSGKSGLMSVTVPGQEVLERTACQMDKKTGAVTLRMEIGFPANGRTVNSRELEKIFFDYVPVCVKKSLVYKALDGEKVKAAAALAEDQTWIRRELQQRGLVAFLANGSILPRESGVSQKPMKQAVPFRSPKEREITLNLPNHGSLSGMAIPRGITMIVGGGYHGKSTLLKALELGVYNHISGDGREYVITDDSAMKIRAEDGRCVKNVDISLFINNLPNGKDTKKFVTEDASGSTSQAANVVEAMEAGSQVFLIDEDTSATNFMIRDELMQRVVHQEVEPITPFTMRIRELYNKFGISTVLVAGSSGSYFHVADYVIQMNQYEPFEITDLAKKEAANFPLPSVEAVAASRLNFDRVIREDKKFGRDDRVKTKTLGMDGISINKETIDLRYVEQLADTEQLNALAVLMKYMKKNVFDGKKTLQQAVKETVEVLEKQGWKAICGGNMIPGNLALPRTPEIFACLNRWRSLPNGKR
ncbi:MAG: ABC-ATPase domain-containing protein [Eubacterium sp.]|nr:ABC-ATPase domain-containing protein [Eubacterium sp.]